MNRTLLILLVGIYSAYSALAQLGGGSGQASTGTAATQLPLSGRSGQTGSVTSSQSALPGTTSSVNALNTNVSVTGPYTGSRAGGPPFSGKLSLREAVQRALEYNLGGVGLAAAIRQAHGQARVARSALLPNLNGALKEAVQQTNLQAQGLRINLPIRGFTFPTIVGPFNYFDLRATLTQSVADMTALNNYRAARETVRADEQTAQDARDLIVLAVGGAYLQTVAAKARVESARAQLETSTALYQQTQQRRQSGLVAQIDVSRSLVQQQTQQQRLATLENDFAKQKINLARIAGIPPNEHYELIDEIPFSPAPTASVDEALVKALASRADLKAAEAQVRAAEKSRSASRAERLPSLALSADYGAIGINPAQSHGTFTVVGTLRFPIWQGGKAEGDIEQSEAALMQRRAELEDTRGRIESDVRSAFLDLQAAASQVELSRANQQLARETLGLTKQKYDAGISDSVEVVQAQESVATSDLDYITSLFAHNLAKLSLARALGHAAENLSDYLKLEK
jgi:outer membrane protein TolC